MESWRSVAQEPVATQTDNQKLSDVLQDLQLASHRIVVMKNVGGALKWGCPCRKVRSTSA